MFFLSHASTHAADEAERAAYLKFFADIENRVRGRRVGPRDAAIAFWDHRDLPAGTPEFNAGLRAALQAHPIGIVLLSPPYLSNDRPYCRWEFEALRRRNEWSSTLQGRPACLLVVDWILADPSHLPVEFPQQLQRVREQIAGDQVEDANAVRAVCDRGLRDVLGLVAAGETAAQVNYERFVARLADYVVRQYDLLVESGGSLAVPEVEAFDGGLTWNQRGAPNAASQPKAGTMADRKRIYCAVAAAHPADVEQVLPARSWRYRDEGSEDWRPFVIDPDEDRGRLADLLNAMVEGRHVDGEISARPLSRHLREELTQQIGKYPVILLVDPWTLHDIEGYRAWGRKLMSVADGEVDSTGVIVLWNDRDADISGEEAERAYKSAIDKAFGERTVWAYGNAGLQEVFCQLVEKLRTRIRSASTPRMVRSGAPKPTLSAS